MTLHPLRRRFCLYCRSLQSTRLQSAFHLFQSSPLCFHHPPFLLFFELPANSLPIAEVPDLTHPPTTLLIHSWLSSPNPPSIDHSHIDLLRHIRVSPHGEVLLTKEGRTEEMGLGNWKGEGEGDDWTTFLEGVSTEKQGQEMEE